MKIATGYSLGFVEAMLFHSWWLLPTTVIISFFFDAIWRQVSKAWDIPPKVKELIES